MTDLALFDCNGAPTIEAARFARALADDGMKRALDHAESDTPGWGDAAMAYLHGYAGKIEGTSIAQ